MNKNDKLILDTLTENDKIVSSEELAEFVGGLPPVDISDAGKVLKVDTDGEWDVLDENAGEDPRIPVISPSDVNKVLKVNEYASGFKFGLAIPEPHGDEYVLTSYQAGEDPETGDPIYDIAWLVPDVPLSSGFDSSDDGKYVRLRINEDGEGEVRGNYIVTEGPIHNFTDAESLVFESFLEQIHLLIASQSSNSGVGSVTDASTIDAANTFLNAIVDNNWQTVMFRSNDNLVGFDSIRYGLYQEDPTDPTTTYGAIAHRISVFLLEETISYEGSDVTCPPCFVDLAFVRDTGVYYKWDKIPTV